MASDAIRIRAARPCELETARRIENAADLRFRRVGLPQVLSMAPCSLRFLERARRLGRLWFALDAFGRPVGFAVLDVVGRRAYLHQVSVLDRAQGRGVGSALIETACAAARRASFDSIFLSTYAHVPWNAPYYARRGFRTVSLPEYTPAMRRLRALESRARHPVWRRCLMERTLG